MQAYGVFANGGYQVTPYYIEKIVDDNNKVIYQREPAMVPQNSNMPNANPTDADAQPIALDSNTVAQQELTPQNAYLMNHALQTVIQQGTGRAARILKRTDLAGKTGTTNDKVDAWFAGFNAKNVAIAWVGFDDQSSLKEYGSQAALPIWIDYMSKALAGTPEATMQQPTGIVSMKINPSNGQPALPDEQNAIFEMFRSQYAPKATTSSNQTSSSNNNSATTNDTSSDSSMNNIFY